VNALLRKLLSGSLDADTFTIVESRPDGDADFLNRCVHVSGNERDQSSSLTKILSPTAARTVAVVDRSADVAAAAKALVMARFCFRGRSPYAPDMVLVNEFRIDDFRNAVVQESTKYFAEQVTANGNGSVAKHKSRASKGLTDEERREEGTTVVVSGLNGAIVDVKKRLERLH
jgi:acyl-CoA reductase-like NAD-dependent aldehyde dehydrogenase